ncbi:radical SAM protein [Pyxidicoccus parkwayensis]|uniref:Radical SAM protein n=1 Tax=Pyxidicoccus parkwayensis TaxID=2813578 RepID=A0ABX7NVG1_9BACT|nr:radical SAM protein [Pyxidicoccus parkwaysis]QSQ21379.1 radical SAM protein [Pyxidicoccus parkwaysis]
MSPPSSESARLIPGMPARVQPGRRFLPQVYILKVASRCNLDCKYCYMYNLADQTWRQQPRKMSEDVLRSVARKVARAGTPAQILFHGGEPMLLGPDYFRRAVRIFQEEAPDVRLDFGMQSNGTLLNEAWIDTLHELGIGVGISLDGPAEVNDLNRVYRGSGRGTHADVVGSLQKLLASEKGSKVLGGALCVINLAQDPLRTYRHFVELGFTRISFLPMDGTYESPPPGKQAPFDDTPLADWLIPIFDEWFQNPRGVTVALFEQIIKLLFGARGAFVDLLSTYPKALVVIETDGGIEPTDSLKSAAHGITKLGLNVLHNELEDMFTKDIFQLLQSGEEGLAQKCRSCAYRYVCGGGLLAHRYSERNGFDNPTVYCADMLKLLGHIERRVGETLSPALVQRIRATLSRAASA